MKSSRKWINIMTAGFAVIWAVLLLWLLPPGKLVYPVRYREEVTALSETYGLDAALVFAVIRTESGFDRNAESPAGAKGLMQITDPTAAYIARERGIKAYDLFDVGTNLDFGCWYLRYLLARFSVRETALAAYNAGEGNVRAWLSDPAYSTDGESLDEIPFSETAAYVKKIGETCEKYRKYYPQLLDKPREIR